MECIQEATIEMSKDGILKSLGLKTGVYNVLGHGYRKVTAYIVHGETIRLEIERKNGRIQCVTYDKDMEILHEEVL